MALSVELACYGRKLALGYIRRRLEVRGLDAIDRTPVLDIKTYMIKFAPRSAVRQPRSSPELMSGCWQVSAT